MSRFRINLLVYRCCEDGRMTAATDLMSCSTSTDDRTTAAAAGAMDSNSEGGRTTVATAARSDQGPGGHARRAGRPQQRR